MSGSDSPHRSGYSTALSGTVLALAIGWPLTSLLGHRVLYVTYFVSALFAARYGGAVPGLCVLIAGCVVGPLVVLSLPPNPCRRTQTSAKRRWRSTPPPASRASYQWTSSGERARDGRRWRSRSAR